jgi:hypothetical protein
VLAGGEEVLGPAVGGGGGHRAVQVDDGVAAQCGGVRVGYPAAKPESTVWVME